MKRTHKCGDLRKQHIGNNVTLNGWVQNRRNLGGLIFIDLRDRYGIIQVVFNPQLNPQLHTQASGLGKEYVISVSGVVEERPQANPELPTGEIDVIANDLTILNKADTPPFEIDDEVEANEELRLKYRYLDLRRKPLQRNLLVRHKIHR
jgi:aspartyl-tRNA synthetase